MYSNLNPKVMSSAGRAFDRAKAGLAVGALVLAMQAGPLAKPSPAAGGKPSLSAGELTDIVREPSVNAKATNLQVVGTGPDVTVMAQVDEGAADRDLKIDAVFVAKALFQNAVGQISKVKVLFSQSGHEGRFVNISDKQILDYGSGKISAEQLLSTLRLLSVEGDKAPDVVQGAQFERRLLLWQRIDKLKRQGTGVVPFETIFGEIEAAIKGGSQDESKKLTYLESKLADQEKLVKQAKMTARGLGVSAPANSSAPSSGSRSGEHGSLADMPSPKGTNTYIPADAQNIRRNFESRHDEVMQAARGRNGYNELDAYRKQIELAFRENRPGDAYALIRKFHELAMQSVGIDIMMPQRGGPGGGPPGGGPPGGFGGGPPGGGPTGGQF